ncbi:acyltransferase [Pseudogulbenkiania sp. NH8B]|uniref:acyltransferase n=1 Tax=Pseudogulbenkiania sp. (strain NH8B) TaxID=748280 RepID=UPI001E6228AC|nr:acyltransferase [Pseudogulbenkiania sp. NH8B]
MQWQGNFDVKLGKGACLGAGTVLCGGPAASIDIGSNAWIGNDCELSTLGMVQIGAHSSLQHRTQLHGEVKIGAACVGAAGLYISSGTHEFRRKPALPIRLQDRAKSRLPTAQRSRQVVVGDDCWLGIGVVVMPGVTIGRGSIVGANSVVTRDLPPYCIAAGAPARIVGQRLNFQPPTELVATNDDHLPYFYSGFRQISDDATDPAPPRPRGGFAADRQFVLALSVCTGQTVEVQFDSTVSGALEFQGIIHPVAPGINTLRWLVQAVSDVFLSFKWLPDSATEPQDTLVVLNAKVNGAEA